MKFIGNYIDWINQNVDLINTVRTTEGLPRPSGYKNNFIHPEKLKMLEKAGNGYDPSATYWYLFDSEYLGKKIDLSSIITGPYVAWIIKMLPGNIMPIHYDSHVDSFKKVKRYWMPLTDWEIGHVFVYENQTITDYKAGDLWQYENPMAFHGSANIGHSLRMILQISTYEK